jgi:hypothetical protein
MNEENEQIIYVADGYIYPNIEFAKGRAQAHKLAFRGVGCSWELQITVMYKAAEEVAGVALFLLVVPKKRIKMIPRQAPQQKKYE